MTPLAAEKLYNRLPIPLQNIAVNIKGFQIQRERYGTSFDRLLAELEERSFWSQSEIEDFRNKRLAQFVDFAAKNVPDYKVRFQELGLKPGDIQSIDDLSKLPVLSKLEVQRRTDRFLSDVSRRQIRPASTSGTTGAGLKFFTTRAAIQEQWAVWWRFRRWHGIERGTWSAHFSGSMIVPIPQLRPPFWRYNYPARQIFFSGYHLSSDNLKFYVDELRRRKPPWIHGYPSMITLLAAYVLDSDRKLDYPVRWVSIGAEGLLPHQSDIIEQAFGVKPIQHYGMAEAVANISECPNGHLHVDEDFAAVEFVPEDSAQHRIVGTNLSNFANPLIRYDTGDLVEPLNALCSCGRPGRLVQAIDGRQEDYIVLKNGARVGAMNRLFKDVRNIREAQIYQERAGEVLFRIVRAEQFGVEDERKLLSKAVERLGADTIMHIQYVDEIERTKTGKLRLVVSRVPDAQV